MLRGRSERVRGLTAGTSTGALGSTIIGMSSPWLIDAVVKSSVSAELPAFIELSGLSSRVSLTPLSLLPLRDCFVLAVVAELASTTCVKPAVLEEEDELARLWAAELLVEGKPEEEAPWPWSLTDLERSLPCF